MKLRILLISSIVPREKAAAASIVLHRHLANLPNIELTCASDRLQDSCANDIVIDPNPTISRLCKTRFARIAHSIRHLAITENHTQLRLHIQNQPPHLILTVAHDPLCWLAQKLSHRFKIPLVTFFHDWLPDIALVPDWIRPVLEKKFRRLYARSQLAFCVSDEMKTALGHCSHARVLYPIPGYSEHILVRRNFPASSPFSIVYAGNLSNIYSPGLKAFASFVQKTDDFKLKLFGPQPDWPNATIEQYVKKKIYGGFLSRRNLLDQLSQADSLLLTMSFNSQDKRRTQTSFPSKLLEYCQFGKPIVIWGPEYCSAVRWGRKHQAALIVTSPSTQDLVDAIRDLVNHPEEQKRLGDKALEMSEGIFCSENIQQQFIEGIRQIVSFNSY
ncbi:MAG: glycosyltransferase [Cyanobacteria bacterium P01_E01_bin.6]